MRHLFKILIHSIAFCTIWMLAFLLTNLIFQLTPPPTEGAGDTLLLMWLCCLLEVSVLHLYLHRCSLSRLNRFITVLTILFVLQFIFTQMETWYYLDDRTIPRSMILTTVVAGLITSIGYSLLITFSYPLKEDSSNSSDIPWRWLVPLILILGVLVYPLLYFLAGYFIAWQSESLRIFYSGSAVLSPFFEVLRSNIVQGTYAFQVFRGIIWTILGLVILRSLIPGNWKLHGTILGLLFAIIMCAQLLIPNPYMPSDIRTFHGLETASSNFIWGMIISFFWHLSLTRIKISKPGR